MLQLIFPAFPEGNSRVKYSSHLDKLVVGNSEGLVKVFDVRESDLEPASIDSLENITALDVHGHLALLANTNGHVEVLDADKSTSRGVVYRGDVPLRDSVFINQGNRIVCGGDETSVTIVDLQSENATTTVSVPDQVLNIAYNHTGELVSLSLANGQVLVYLVAHETPVLVETLDDAIVPSVPTSVKTVDYLGAHSAELVLAQCKWSPSGEHLLVPGRELIQVVNRSDWKSVLDIEVTGAADYEVSTSGKLVAVLVDTTVKLFSLGSGDEVSSFALSALNSHKPINLTWGPDAVYVGLTNGQFVRINNLHEDLLVDDEASEDDEPVVTNGRVHAEDSHIIDEDDDDEDPLRFYNQPVDEVFDERRRKRQRTDRPSARPLPPPADKIEPYSPGSTPWSDTTGSSRRYLAMNSIGYVWQVRGSDSHSVTVSFFDRTVNKEYHFGDAALYDICSMNNRGVVLATSQHGKIFYRHHNGITDSWERTVPLLPGEYLTSVSISAGDSTDAIITVGTSLGYVRFFNLYGLAINLIKTNPVVTLVASASSTLLILTQTSGVFAYSLVDVNSDYKFIQQDVLFPLVKIPSRPLLKGIFFNEYNDPCYVAGSDDTLVVLLNWREAGNAKWVPLLDCHDAVTEHGSSNKRLWKCWPLGLDKDQLNCLILKNNNPYPGFPLPLPIELEIRLPIAVHEPKNDLFGEEPSVDSDNAEELFLRASTMGKLVNDTMNDEEIDDDDEILDRLQNYSVVFDKSLLKLFAGACQDAKLNKALSVVKLIKNDKALLAAAKIAERFEYLNLAGKIAKLRDDLVELDD